MQSWKQFSIEIDNQEDSPLGPSSSAILKCPKCTYKRKNKEATTLHVNIEGQSWFCRHCGWSGHLLYGVRGASVDGVELNPFNPAIKGYEPNLQLSKHVIERFKQRCISMQTLQKFKIGQQKVYFPSSESDCNSIVFPYYKNSELINLVYFHSDKRHHEFGGIKTCFNYDNINENHTYIVADEFEVLSFSECGIDNCISIFGEEVNVSKLNKILDFLPNIEDKLSKIQKITLAMPNTQYGQSLKEELIRRLGKGRCWVVNPPEPGYDWSKVLVDYGKDHLKALLEKEKPTPVDGIFELDDVEEGFDYLYSYGLTRGASTGFSCVDPYYTVVPGQWTLVTGIPGHGKSNFLDALIVNLATLHDWRFAFFSPENQPIQRHFANLLEKKLAKPFNLGFNTRISPEEKDLGKEWIKKHCSVILPSEDASWSIDGVLDLAKVLVYRKGIKGLVIDPWNEIDHSRTNNKTETEYISECLTKVRQFARNYGVHVWLVAHPTKMGKDAHGRYLVPTPYDVAGSSHFRNKADNAISIWRNIDGKDRDVVDIYIQKIRFKEVGKVGMVAMRFEYESGKFHDDIDQAKRLAAIESANHEETSKYIKKQTSKSSNLNLFKDAKDPSLVDGFEL